MNNLVQIYEWGYPEWRIRTVHGRIPYKDYLAKQYKYLMEPGDRMVEIRYEIRNKRNQISLWANQLCGMSRCRETGVFLDNIDKRFYCKEHINSEDGKPMGH